MRAWPGAAQGACWDGATYAPRASPFDPRPWKTSRVPTWITSRRLGATAALYAVFVGGWFLGQPLANVGCHTPEPLTAIESDETINEPGDVVGDLRVTAGTARQVVTAEVFDTASIVPCDSTTSRPRLVAWVTGDWR